MKHQSYSIINFTNQEREKGLPVSLKKTCR
uniref:Uncharacterized protein n=1 Tax=Rhizophora mucronata TaxID=61149 RepID=A0A2P2Q666_RHIMU